MKRTLQERKERERAREERKLKSSTKYNNNNDNNKLTAKLEDHRQLLSSVCVSILIIPL